MVIFKWKTRIWVICNWTKFTFQYGDIQIKYFEDNKNSHYIIYIPIWWYSNSRVFENEVGKQIDLHSNMVIFKSLKSEAYSKGWNRFTFQYGDIQIEKIQTLNLTIAAFTFQYGDIQIIMYL